MENIELVLTIIGVVILPVIGIFLKIVFSKISSNQHQESLRHDYAYEVFKNRMKIYPALNLMVCKYARAIKAKTLSQGSLKTYHNNIAEWDMEHALKVSIKTKTLIHVLLKEMTSLANQDEKQFTENIQKNNSRLRNSANNIELSLRNELGVNDFHSPSHITKSLKFNSFQEMDAYVKKIK